MTFNEYQRKAIVTDLAADAVDKSISSTAFFDKLLGLLGETGEVAEKFKKIYRDNNGQITNEQIQSIKKELGDVLWYISVMSSYLGISLDDVATYNTTKLESRSARGTLSGSGDNR